MSQEVTYISSEVALTPVSGRFDAHQAPRVQKTVDVAMDSGVKTIIMDLSDVNFVDSSALAVVVRTMKHCHERGGELVLCALRQPVRIIFELTRMDKAFRIVDSVDDARTLLDL